MGRDHFQSAECSQPLVYVLEGEVLIRADGREQQLKADHAVGLFGSDASEERVTVQNLRAADLIVLSGLAIREAIVAQGPFIMNEPRQIEAAAARYRTGAMGRLARLQIDSGQEWMALVW